MRRRILLGLLVGCTPATPDTPAEALPLGVGTGAWGLTCVLDAKGRADCWGIADCDLPLPEFCQQAPALCPGAAQVLPPSGAGLHDLRVGATHACALDLDDEAVCWGDPRDGQLDAPEGPFASVSPGAWHTCGLRPTGELACWGDDAVGQSSPPASGGWVDVSASGSFSCGVREDTTLACWGLGPVGQLEVPTSAGWRSVHTSEQWVCAVDVEGAVACWGRVPDEVTWPETVATLSLGSTHLCWTDDAGVVGCGGEAGLADPPSGLTASHLDAGIVHSCALDMAGELVCWSGSAVPEICIP